MHERNTDINIPKPPQEHGHKPVPLLTIELQDETSVPKVFYKGEEIELKQHIFFDWDTDTDEFGGLTYAIEHIDKNKGCPVLNRIERRTKGHAFD